MAVKKIIQLIQRNGKLVELRMPKMRGSDGRKDTHG